jgi:hypothetical protein
MTDNLPDKQLQLIYVAYGQELMTGNTILICWHTDQDRASQAGQLIAMSRQIEFIGLTAVNNADLEAPSKILLRSQLTEDLGNIVIQTDVELERLGWTSEQTRDYLFSTYNKRARTLLNEEQMADFLERLKQLP